MWERSACHSILALIFGEGFNYATRNMRKAKRDAILAGMLLPALNQARDRAKTTNCLNNLRQLSLACEQYRNDFKDRMPPWISTLYPLLCRITGADRGRTR